MIQYYFVNTFTSEEHEDMSDVLGSLDTKVTEEMNEILTKPYTTDEITRAIKQMHLVKTPGPDGMTPLLFQKFWHVIHNDVLDDIMGVSNNGRDPKNLNHSHIVLIQKIKKLDTPKDFHY